MHRLQWDGWARCPGGTRGHVTRGLRVSYVTCCRVVSQESAEIHEPPQPPRGLPACLLLPDDLGDACDGELQPPPQLL